MLQGQYRGLEDTVRKLMEALKEREKELEQSRELNCYLQQRLDQQRIMEPSPQPECSSNVPKKKENKSKRRRNMS